MVGPLVDRHVAEGRGDTPALRMAQRELSYADLLELVNRAGNALRDSGIEPEQRVAILLPDGAEFVAAFLGAMKIGAVPVPMNTGARPNELQLMIADCRARALVADASLVGPAEQTPSAQLRAVFVVGGDDDRRSFSAAVQRASRSLDAFPTGVDEPCYWLYSSGTTASARTCLQAVEGVDVYRAAGRSREHRGRLHLLLEPAGTRAAGLERGAHRRSSGAHRRRGWPGRRVRRAVAGLCIDRASVLEPTRANQANLLWRVAADGRSLLSG